MKRKWFSVIACALAATMLCSSCIGSFSLTNKLLSWNKGVGNKFTNEVVFFLFWILPAYEVSLLADLLVLNSIEFWSGNKPLEASTRTIEGSDGRYLVESDQHGYTITSENDGSTLRLNFDEKEQTWSMVTPQGNEQKLMTFIDADHVSVPTPDGGSTVVELSRQGIGEFAMAF